METPASSVAASPQKDASAVVGSAKVPTEEPLAKGFISAIARKRTDGTERASHLR
jgi:hypothetical protein